MRPDNEDFLLSTLLKVTLGGIASGDQPKSPFDSGYQEKLYSLHERWIAAKDSTAEKEEVKRAMFREGLGIENASDGYDTVSDNRYFWFFCRGQPGTNGYWIQSQVNSHYHLCGICKGNMWHCADRNKCRYVSSAPCDGCGGVSHIYGWYAEQDTEWKPGSIYSSDVCDCFRDAILSQLIVA